MSNEKISYQRQYSLLDELMVDASTQTLSIEDQHRSQQQQQQQESQAPLLQQQQQVPLSPEYEYLQSSHSNIASTSSSVDYQNSLLYSTPLNSCHINSFQLEDYLDWNFNNDTVDEELAMPWFDVESVFYVELEEDEEEKANIQLCAAAAIVVRATIQTPVEQQPTEQDDQ